MPTCPCGKRHFFAPPEAPHAVSVPFIAWEERRMMAGFQQCCTWIVSIKCSTFCEGCAMSEPACVRSGCTRRQQNLRLIVHPQYNGLHLVELQEPVMGGRVGQLCGDRSQCKAENPSQLFGALF
eukprot:3254413-Rhodomonas_salina.1